MFQASLIGILVALQALAPAFERSLFVAPLFIEYTSVSDETFAREARDLKQRLGTSPAARVGFAAGLTIAFPDIEVTLKEVDLIVERARRNDIPVHIGIVSGFFHGQNALRYTAIQNDVRNAQWFADGTIAPPEDGNSGEVPRTAWVTPSRYALPLRTQIEDGVRKVGARLASLMAQYPQTLLSVAGDGEVELSFERSDQGLLADYSPFAVAEFRDWLQDTLYNGDLSPASDDNRDGRTFNKDFGQKFRTWELRYFERSGPIPYRDYLALPEKLPRDGPHFVEGGFDAPRSVAAGKRYWQTWERFRIRMVGNYLNDFAEWLTVGGRIPASRYFSYQIPGEFLFGNKNSRRLHTSASPVSTAFIEPFGSPGVTAYNTYDGRKHSRTAGKNLFDIMRRMSAHWGILEYNPSVPAVADEKFYLDELRTLQRYRPRIVVPFAWQTPEVHRQYEIKGTAFESALRKWLQEIR